VASQSPKDATAQASPHHVVIGTAGHIDHGKTSLVKALTGVDTDRLKEEKERGITIELGFAPIDLPGVGRAGVVDVPGHERFVRHMVAGAFGIDIVMLVVAADEGVMPQTREHTDICALLGVRQGLVALTKADLVDEELLELATLDVREYLAGTFLEAVPLVPVSVQTGRGLDTLRATLAELARAAPGHARRGVSLLPVDRSFTMKGFGTVVTGTTVSGAFEVGSAVEILPGRVQAKVRGVQVHGASCEVAHAGQRTALNLAGVGRDEVPRGAVVATPGLLSPSPRIDASVRVLPMAQRALKHRARGLFYTGTSQSLCTVLLQDRDAIEPGSEGPAQVLLESQVVTLPGERFILRGFTTLDNYGYTVGGGEVLDPTPPPHRRGAPATRALFEALLGEDVETRIDALALAAGTRGVTQAELELRVRAPSGKALERAVQALLSRRALVRYDADRRAMIHGAVLGRLTAQARERVEQFHREHPARDGIGREELRTQLMADLDVRLYQSVMNELTRDGTFVEDGTLLRRADHQARLGAGLAALAERVHGLYRGAALQPPLTREVAVAVGASDADVAQVLERLVAEGHLVCVKPDLYFDAPALGALKAAVVDFIGRHGEMNTGQFKELSGTTRKYAIPLSEYFDRERVTIRVGDVRRLR
jgi:selenocysteine-specific elongation factor